MSDPVPTEQDYLDAARAYFHAGQVVPEVTVEALAQSKRLRTAVNSGFAAGWRARDADILRIYAETCKPGPCGSPSPTLWEGDVPEVCALTAGHLGWHQNGVTSWGPLVSEVPSGLSHSSNQPSPERTTP